MRISYLLSEIIKGQWAIEPQTALSYGSFVASLLSDHPSPAFNRHVWENLVASSKSSSESIDSFDNAPESSVAIIPITGEMLKYGTMCSYGTTEIADYIQQASMSKNISSIILKIDSGGGAVNAIPPILQVIKSSNKPFVALCDTAASAAYFVASTCDHIMADNNLSAGFGSIGVVSSFVDMQPYWEQKGFVFHTVYAPESKDKNQSFELALKGDYTSLQNEILSPLAIQFQNHVKESRAGKLNEKEPGVLSGKMFFAEDALRCGLIDSIGNLQHAVKKAIELAEIKKFMNS